MEELIAPFCISLAGFSLFAFLLSRFTAIPGFRVWMFAVFIVLSYPVAAAYLLASSWLCGFFQLSLAGDRVGEIVWWSLLVTALLAGPGLLWLLVRYSIAVRRRPVRIWWFLGPVLPIAATIVYLKLAAIPSREFDYAWYSTPRHWSEQEAAGFARSHRWAVFHAEADHLFSPVGYSRCIRLMDASSDPSGDLFLRFIARHFSSSADVHLLPVYCWSSQEQRLVWKAVEDHSP